MHCDRSARRVAVLLAAAVLVVGSLPPAAARADLPALTDISDAFEELTQQVGPSVVQIFVTRFQGSFVGSTTQDLLARRRSTGSGVILDPSGYIVTNAHVVQGSRRVQVLLNHVEQEGGSSILKGRGKLIGAQVVGIDSETDLAVLKIQATDLPHLELADSDQLRQGELVMAFGSPLGLQNTVTFGVVSSVARQLRPEAPMIYIQTDASINPGNSGGPLVNTVGEVVGINTLILSQSGGDEGIGFAAPSNIVRNVYEQLKASGRVRRGEIGVHAQTITPTLGEALGLERTTGVVLGDVHPGGPAARAGLEIGDIILSLDGKTIENGRQLDVNLYSRKIGQVVIIEALRGDREMSFKVAVTEREDNLTRFVDRVSPERNLIPELGILGLDLDDEIAKMLAVLREKSGVVVAALAADAPFWEDGLLPGDVIHSVNGTRVKKISDLRRQVGSFSTGDPVVLHIERRGQQRYVAFEFER
jgi:serine protease Do